MSRKFLIPVATAVAALSAGSPTGATQSCDAQVDKAKQQSPDVLAGSDAQHMIYPAGDALHSLLLARTDKGIVLAQHESHYSHSSHASHASHASHYSGN